MGRPAPPGTLAGAPTAAAVLVGAPIAAAICAMALGWTIGGWSKVCWDVAWTAGAIAALSGTLLARAAAPAAERTRWTLWATASGCWLCGQVIWNIYGIIGFPPSPTPADGCWWAFAVLVMASLITAGARSRAVRAVAVAETLPLIAAAVALSVAELWHDAAVTRLATAPTLSALAYPAVYTAAAVLMLQAMVGGSLRRSRSAALQLVLGGIAAQAVAFGLWSPQLLAGTYSPGSTALDPLWVVGLAMIGLGGAIASRRPARVVEVAESAAHGAILPAAMFVVLSAALIRALLGRAPAGAEDTLGVGLLLSGAALIARGSLLERRLRELLGRERAALAALEEREAQLAALNAQLVEDSRRDALTGLRNRRALADDLRKLESTRECAGRPFALALCDVDHFKAYNDRLGHLAGDQALRSIAGIARGALRAGDVAYRFGGEELLLILPGAGLEEAVAAVERVRTAVQRAGIQHPDGVGGVLTVSIGVAAGDEDSGVLLARADAALYGAKRDGRNRVAAGAESWTPLAGVRQRSLEEEPVPRHLRSMLAVSRAAASGRGPMPVLEALAETIRSELSFHIVAVRLREPASDTLTCVIVLGDDDARRVLLDTVSPWSEWQRLMRPEHERRGAIWLPAGTPAWEEQAVTWTPATAAAPGADSWHPDDMLLLPLRGQDGEVLGLVAVDQPAGGRRPDDDQIAVLMSVADHAGLGLEQSLRASAQSLPAEEQSSELRLAAVMLLAETLDLRDPGTARHARTVGAYARQTAIALGLAEDRVARIHAAGVLHDLGKLGIADAILYKPGPLDDCEWREIERHPEIGARILTHAGLHDLATWVRAHHERLDGQGYPDRLRADEIPLEARILAVADAYEAMVADRPYRAGMAPELARAELERCAGTQFDPAVVAAFAGVLCQDAAPLGGALESAA